MFVIARPNYLSASCGKLAPAVATSATSVRGDLRTRLALNGGIVSMKCGFLTGGPPDVSGDGCDLLGYGLPSALSVSLLLFSRFCKILPICDAFIWSRDTISPFCVSSSSHS